MLFDNKTYDFDVLNLAGFNFNESPQYFNMDNRDKLVPTREGFLRGNMWANEYVPYKNMKYVDLIPTCEREKHLFKIMEIDFAINDLNLYLDLHPEDQAIYEKFKNLTEECIRLKDEYARNFGPLTLDETPYSQYEWLKNPWPWDNDGGSMYV